jgi:hypothetical protein
MCGWRGKRRELTALIGSLAVMFALTLWGASSAAAGGPTSVLVTSPASGEAHALYHSDKEYAELQRLLGPMNAGSRDKPPEAGLTRVRPLNVTWLAHDIAPWRLDRVFVGESRREAVWIHTATDVPESMNGSWHRAEHPAALHALFTKLGVLDGTVSGDGYTGIFPGPWASEASAAPAPGADAATLRTGAPGTDDGTGWWWALPGAAAGAVMALALRPLIARVGRDRPRRERGPRQELRDV